jgi:hypothetical protein
MLFLSLFLFSLPSLVFPSNLCWRGDSDCPSPCPKTSSGAHSLTSTFFLHRFPEITSNDERAQSLLKNLNSTLIQSFDPPILLHTTVQYICCLSFPDLAKITSIFRGFQWEPFEVTYAGYFCNADHSGKTVYITTTMTEDSEQRMFAFVGGLETAILEKGINITKRIQGFHNTLARVDPAYPVDKAMTILNETIPVIGTATFDRFQFGIFVFHANGTTELKK